MPSRPLIVDGRVVGIVCTSRVRSKPCACGSRSIALCDYPLLGWSSKNGKTCSRPICAACGAPWSLTAPVQPSPDYRAQLGGDLCRVHRDMVARGHGRGMLALFAALMKGSQKSRILADRLKAAPLAELPAILDAAAEDGRRYLLNHGQLGGATAERVELLTAALAHLAVSLRAAGDPAAVYEAEARAMTSLGDPRVAS